MDRTPCVLAFLLVLGACGDGGGQTIAEIVEEIEETPWHVWAVAEDMNADGDPDIVSISHITDTNEVTLNIFVRQASGNYAKRQVRVGDRPQDHASHVLVDDLNLDGMPDVVISHRGPTQVGSEPGRGITVLLKSGAGPTEFAEGASYTAGDMSEISATGDLDLDGLPDIAVASRSGLDLLLQDGGNVGRFLSARRIHSAQVATAVIVDIDRDGLPDVLSADRNGVLVFLNDLNDPGAFRSHTTWPLSDWTCGIAVGDFNGDSWLDFATCDQSNEQGEDASIARRLQDPQNPGSFGGSVETSYNDGASLDSIDSADLNGDGLDDLVLAISSGIDDVAIAVHLARPGGAFAAPTFVRDDQAAGPWSAIIEQLGPDDLHDVVLANALKGVYIQEGNGDGAFNQARKVGE